MTNFGYGKVVAVFSAATVTPPPPKKKPSYNCLIILQIWNCWRPVQFLQIMCYQRFTRRSLMTPLDNAKYTAYSNTNDIMIISTKVMSSFFSNAYDIHFVKPLYFKFSRVESIAA